LFGKSVDYSINTKGNQLTIILTNVTSLTSGTLGKELFPSALWPSSILIGSQLGTNENTNYAQTFSITFKLSEVMKEFKKKK
jgi:hypothetical protein